MTFADMQTAVGELINQSVTDDTRQVTLTEVKRNLNIGYQKVVNVVSTLSGDYYTRLAKADLVADQSAYGLPDDFRTLRRLEVGYTSGTQRERAQRVDLNALQDPKTTYSTAAPMFFLSGDMIELLPGASSSVTDGLWMYYTETVPDMVSGTDVPNVPPGYEDLPILYATAKAKMRQGLIDEGKESLREFKGELFEMIDQAESRGEDSHDFVIVRDMYNEV